MHILLQPSVMEKQLIGISICCLALLGIAIWLLWKSRKPSLAAFFGITAICIGGLGVGAASPKGAIFGKFISHGSRNTNVVALTFDDGPDPAYTPDVLAILSRYNAKATFFMLGERVKKYPELAQQVADEGHTIGSHCNTHVSLLLATPKQIKNEIAKADDAIQSELGMKPNFIRAPYGFHPPFFLREAGRRHYIIAGWTISPHDSYSRKAGTLARRVLTHVKPGDIILLHDGRENRKATVAALPAILDGLQKKGLRCVPLEELTQLE